MSINPKALEETLDLLKEFDERIVTPSYIFGRLYKVYVKTSPRIAEAEIRTARRMPIPTKITFAGGNACTITLEYTSSSQGRVFRDALCQQPRQECQKTCRGHPPPD